MNVDHELHVVRIVDSWLTAGSLILLMQGCSRYPFNEKLALPLHNSNPDVVALANHRFASICLAIGQVEPFGDSEVLHYRPFVAKFNTMGNIVAFYSINKANPRAATWPTTQPRKKDLWSRIKRRFGI